MAVVRHKEAIHSGHFMVSDFEAEAEDELDLPPPPEEGCNLPQLMSSTEDECAGAIGAGGPTIRLLPEPKFPQYLQQQISRNHSAQSIIDISLNKLFQSMSIAYRQKLTSPKWNRFRGLKLRWKDKIRLNNVIWRCWHLQFVKGRNRLLCAFANPLDIDNHNFPEGGTVLEGKYWKRKLQTITREYMRWRMFYKNRGSEEGEDITDQQWDLIFQSPFQMLEGSKDDAALEALAPEEDFFVDALFTSLQFDSSRNPAASFAVPYSQSSRGDVNKKTTNSDFIQPCLAPLQPNLDDFFMELDCQSAFSDWQLAKLLTIQETGEGSMGTSPGNVAAAVSPQQQSNQFQQQQQQSMAAGRTKSVLSAPEFGLVGNGDGSSSSSSMLSFPGGDLQSSQRSVLAPGSMLGAHYLQSEQQTAMGAQALEMPMQQGGGFSNTGDLYSYAPQQQKKLTGPITCTSEKRHSPKHRILHHRDYHVMESQQLPSSSSYDPSSVSKSPVQYVGSGSSSRSAGLLESSSPYKLPAAISAPGSSSSSSAAAAAAAAQTMSFLEPRVKTRSYSGPSDVQMTPKTFLASRSVSYVSNPNSELVQLLKTNKNIFQQPAPHQVPVSVETPHMTSPPGGLTLNVNQLRSLALTGSSAIPPPPASSAPQPRLDVGDLSPSSRCSMGGSGFALGDPSRGSFRGKTDTRQYQEHRRSIHISSEQKRRGSIKNGFELMRSLIPSLSQSCSAKISKAALLLKGGDYLQQLKTERHQLAEEINSHRELVEQLNAEIAGLQSSMASNGSGGVCMAADTLDQLKALFDLHVERCTMQNWKYWVFSRVMKPLLRSFQSTVKSGSFEEMARTSSNWVDQNLSLVQLRPMALGSLKDLSTGTDILTHPEGLPEEAVRAAANFKLSSECEEEAEEEGEEDESQGLEEGNEFDD